MAIDSIMPVYFLQCKKKMCRKCHCALEVKNCGEKIRVVVFCVPELRATHLNCFKCLINISFFALIWWFTLFHLKSSLSGVTVSRYMPINLVAYYTFATIIQISQSIFEYCQTDLQSTWRLWARMYSCTSRTAHCNVLSPSSFVKFTQYSAELKSVCSGILQSM